MAEPILYFDEDACKGWVLVALARTRQVFDARSTGNLGRADDDQIAIATGFGAIIVTYNRRDFVRIHATLLAAGESHSEILVLFQGKYADGHELRRIQQFISVRTAEEMRDRIEFISSPDFDPD